MDDVTIQTAHDEADLIGIFAVSKEILIYGTGRLSRYIIDVISSRKYHGMRDYIKAVLVRDKVCETFMGITTIQADFDDNDREATVLVAVPSEDIVENIRYLEANNYHKLIVLSLDFEKRCLLSPFAYKPRAFLRVEVSVVQHCNLNCRGCMTFSPIAKNEFLDITEYERDIKRLSELFYSEHDTFQILGGEPLLHPEIEKFMKVTRMNFPYGTIKILTNGLLLHKMAESFWKTCQEYRIDITPTQYPIKYDYEKIRDIADKYGVKYSFIHGHAIKTLERWPLSLKGDGDIEDNFNHCRLANMCPVLFHGKIYGCGFPTTVYHLNSYYNMQFKESEKDGIDIYKADTAEQIMEFISKPIPFCRYCNVNNVTFGLPYGISKKEKSEWVD